MEPGASSRPHLCSQAQRPPTTFPVGAQGTYARCGHRSVFHTKLHVGRNHNRSQPAPSAGRPRLETPSQVLFLQEDFPNLPLSWAHGWTPPQNTERARA